MKEEIQLKEVGVNQRKYYLELLKMADESEEIVKEYMHDGDMYSILSGRRVVGVILFTHVSSVEIELKNIALLPECRGKGIGKKVIYQSYEIYKKKSVEKMIVGTANSSIANLAFYQKAGFRMVNIKRDFFMKYAEPIFEDGIRAIDMIMFEKAL